MPTNIESVRPPQEIGIAWQSPEYRSWPRSRAWMLGLTIFVIILGIIFAILKLYFGVAVVVLAWVFFLTEAKAKPKMISYRLRDDKLLINRRSVFLKEFKSFWVAVSPEVKRIYLDRERKLHAPVVVELGDEEPLVVVGHLKKYLKIVRPKPFSFAEGLMLFLGIR